MCTAATYKTKDFYMGRTLDYEFSYGEQITITPRNYEFDFRFAGKIKSHYALIGMAFVAEGYPLYYDAVNVSLPRRKEFYISTPGRPLLILIFSFV